MDLSAFSNTYSEARDKFLAAARDAGAELNQYEHDAQRGPDGERLYLDCARIGPRDARRMLVVISGTHGIEGYSGSAAQSHWLRATCDAPRAPDTAVLLIHAHNPWGFAHGTRVTEENVDLNRNFVDFARPLPANPGYERVHELIALGNWDERSIADAFADLVTLRAELGEQAYSDAFNGGQYVHPDGLFFGGTRPQWANRTFHAVLKAHSSHVEDAALIDLHTGIGPRLGHVFLCFHAPGTTAHERARLWWGERAVNREGVTHKAVARYQGLVVDAFSRALPNADTTAVVVEFGTLPREAMQRANMAARWLRFEAPKGARADRIAEVQRLYREAFYPGDREWRQAVLEQSKELIDRGVSGIGAACAARDDATNGSSSEPSRGGDAFDSD